MADLVTLNVGGTLYSTTVATLTRYPDSMLGSMFSGRVPSHRDSDGHYTIDGDRHIFRHVLNFLRRSSLCLPHDFQDWDLLSAEADFFQIQKLIDAVKSLKEKRSGEGSRQEMEFIELCFHDNNTGVMYSGTAATLKAIPALWLHFNSPKRRGYYRQKSFEDLVDADGLVTGIEFARNDGLPIRRVKIYQEITQLGFRLMKTYRQEAVLTQVIVFGRNT